MKVLYLIQTYKNLPQIRRLVATIKRSSPGSAVLIGHNSELIPIDPAAFRDLPDVHVFHVAPVNRVDFSMMQAYLDCIAHARSVGIDFDWVVTISGQCYPTRPLAEFELMLAATPYDGFMDYFEVFTPSERRAWDDDEAASRYNYQYHWRVTTSDLPTLVRKALGAPRRIINGLQPYLHINTRYALQIGLRGRSDIFTERFKLYGGSYWKTLSRRAVDYLCDFALRQREITDYFRKMIIPDEVFPQTVLVNNPDLRFSSDDLYFIRWDTNTAWQGRPKILTRDDFPAIVERGAFFARKFEPDSDSLILDMLDRQLLGVTMEGTVSVQGVRLEGNNLGAG